MNSAALADGAAPVSPRLLEARSLQKRFGGIHAVRDVNFHVSAGEIVGLVGPNGSGKSTLLGCLSRDIPIDSGSIVFNAIDVTRRRAMDVARSGLARTFQTSRIFPELTVRENALLGRQWRGVGLGAMIRPADADTRQRATGLLEMMEISHLTDQYAGNISGGQRRLLELVMAMMSRPSLVMLDEATSGVNPTLIESLKAHVKTLNRQERVAFVVVEHNVGFVFSIAHRIVVLDEGSLLADDSPEEILKNQEVIDAYLGA
jgi:branched-chain amino acid transport system ATP-binding protein